MKRILFLFLSILLSLSFISCDRNDNNNETTTTAQTIITTEDGKMKPVRFVESKGMIICGKSGGDVGSAWYE